MYLTKPHRAGFRREGGSVPPHGVAWHGEFDSFVKKETHYIVAVLLLFPLGNYANPAIDLFQGR